MRVHRVVCLLSLLCFAIVSLVHSADLYKILGVPKSASVKEIKQAYRRLALELHPDKLGANATADDEAKFIELARAYEILSDEQARAHYDQHGDDASGSGSPRFTPAKTYQGEHFDLYASFAMGAFELHWRQATPPTPPMIMVELPLTLEEVFTGVQKTIHVDRKRFCPACHGTGAASHEHTERCSACDGSGRHMYIQADQAGYSHIVHAQCHVCEGTGRITLKPCPTCSGTRYQQNQTALEVNIPPGAPAGSQLPIQGEGHQQLHHQPGSVVVRISHLPHRWYTVEPNGIDLVYTLRIPLIDALLGFSRKIPTICNNTVFVEHDSVPFSGGYRQMFPALGLPHHQEDRRGDFFVKVNIKFPRQLNDRQRSLLMQVLGEEELAVLEDVIRLANAGLAERSSLSLGPLDYLLTRQCSRDPFFCLQDPRLEMIVRAQGV